MDILTKHQDVEARLQDIQEERQRKIGEKAAKEAAVEVMNSIASLHCYEAIPFHRLFATRVILQFHA